MKTSKTLFSVSWSVLVATSPELVHCDSAVEFVLKMRLKGDIVYSTAAFNAVAEAGSSAPLLEQIQLNTISMK